MHTINTGIHITRRKQMNIITDDDENPVWTGPSIFRAVEWLIDNQIYAAILRLENEAFKIMIGRFEE